MINFGLRDHSTKNIKRALKQIKKACREEARRRRPSGNVYYGLTMSLNLALRKRRD